MFPTLVAEIGTRAWNALVAENRYGADYLCRHAIALRAAEATPCEKIVLFSTGQTVRCHKRFRHDGRHQFMVPGYALAEA